MHKLSEKIRNDEEALFVFEPSSIYTRSFEKVVGSSEVFIRRIIIPTEVVRNFEERAKFGDELGIKGLRYLIELANKLNI